MQLQRMKHAIPPLITVLTPKEKTSDFLGLQPIISNFLSKMICKQHFEPDLGLDISVITLGKGASLNFLCMEQN